MALRWRCGERPATEEFLAQYPELREDPAAAAELIYEEYCLRREQGESVDPLEFLKRFPQWRDPLAVLLDCARLLDPGRPSARWPAPGERLGDCQLQTELGRGAVSRVYLATQPHLANRPVVLKVTPNDGCEYFSLARLQHTHIVPLYSVQEDSPRGLRVLCMPYFGGTTLARLLEMLSRRSLHARKGLDILESLDKSQAGAAVLLPARGPAWRFLAHSPYVEAVCFIGACLADALHYAHARGLVHLDLKPSNVLITIDGQPMLLDFHLAREPVQPGASATEWLGGTVGYMSPEQEIAVAAVREGGKIPLAVDRRSDVYSLGLILYQSLGGPMPLSSPLAAREDSGAGIGEFRTSCAPLAERGGYGPGRLDQCNPQVSRGLADIVAKCLERNPADRYADAASLAADLRRHLAHLPLAGVANRSFTERWRKWRRRRPQSLPIIVMVLAVFAAAAAVALITRANIAQRLAEARAALDGGSRHLDERRYADAVAALRRARAVAEPLPQSRDLTTRIHQLLQLAERGQLLNDVHSVADQIRFLYASDLTPSDALRALESHCYDVWQNRDLITERLGSDLRPDFKDRVRTDLLDVAILWSDLHVRLAAPAASTTARHEALRVLDDAESFGGASPVLSLERQHHARALGVADAARAAGARARELTARTAWEHYALGHLLLRSGDLEAAADAFDRATVLDPGELWPNFYAGVCAYRLGRYAEAVVAFTACVGAVPERAACFYNRALTYTALGRVDRALRDYDRAIQLDPHLAAATLNRGILYLGTECYVEAIADLERALADGADPAVVHYNLAIVYLAQHDRAAAQASLHTSLAHDPTYKEAIDLRDRLRRER